MAQEFNVPIGDMKELVDLYDQPTDPDPSGGRQPGQIFASNVWAKIEDLWSTSGPRFLPQQILTEVSHRIFISYLAGVKSSMYVIWHHADGDRRLDLAAKPGDPDGNRRYLRILAIERDDGAV